MTTAAVLNTAFATYNALEALRSLRRSRRKKIWWETHMLLDWLWAENQRRRWLALQAAAAGRETSKRWMDYEEKLNLQRIELLRKMLQVDREYFGAKKMQELCTDDREEK